jgi:hypothetical protein
MFMHKDEARTSRLLFSDSLSALVREPQVAAYLGALAEHHAAMG